MLEILKSVCEQYGYKDVPNALGITLEDILEGALSTNISKYLIEKRNCSKSTATNILKKVFPDRDPIMDRNIRIFLLNKWGVRQCPKCLDIKGYEEFTVHKSGNVGYCKDCQRTARRESYAKDPHKEYVNDQIRHNRLKEHQTPKWAELDEIKEFYINRPKGMHVDHIIPLNGRLVSGLHVIGNLQYLTAEDNLRKNNLYSI